MLDQAAPALPVFVVDPQIEAFEAQVYDTPLIQDVLKKYLYKADNETLPHHIYRRVAAAIGNSPIESNPQVSKIFYELMNKRLFVPGGRILAGAGTAKHVTLMNCYVNGTLEDSIEGIADGKKRLLITSAMGGEWVLTSPLYVLIMLESNAWAVRLQARYLLWILLMATERRSVVLASGVLLRWARFRTRIRTSRNSSRRKVRD